MLHFVKTIQNINFAPTSLPLAQLPVDRNFAACTEASFDARTSLVCRGVRSHPSQSPSKEPLLAANNPFTTGATLHRVFQASPPKISTHETAQASLTCEHVLIGFFCRTASAVSRKSVSQSGSRGTRQIHFNGFKFNA